MVLVRQRRVDVDSGVTRDPIMTGAGEDTVSTSLSTPKPHQQQHHHHHLSLKSLRASTAYIPAKNDFSYVPRTAGDTPPKQGGSKGSRRQEQAPLERSGRQRGKEASKALRRKHSNVVRSYSCECVRGRGEEEEDEEEEEEKVAGPQGDAGGAGLSIPAAPGADGRVCSKGSSAPRSNSLPQQCTHTTPQHCHGGNHSCGSPVHTGLHVNLRECGLFCDEKQKVQRVVKVGGGEIQVEVISSELVVKREPRENSGDGSVVSGADTTDEKPTKKKRKFIIILKGLLSKSKRSEKKKCVEGESGRASVGAGKSEAVTHTNGKNNNKRDVKCGGGDGRGEANSGAEREARRWGGGQAGRGETRLDAARKQQTPLSCSRKTAACSNEGDCDYPRTGNLDGRPPRSSSSSANSTSRCEANDNTRSGGSTEGGWENSAACLGTREQLTLLYHAALTRYSHVENGWREDTRERRPSSTGREQDCATKEGSRDAFSDESREECPESSPDAQVTSSCEREELHHPQHSTTFTCEGQSLINPSIFSSDASEPSLETHSPADQEGISHSPSEASESFTAGEQSEECSAITSDPPGDSVCHQSENCHQNVKLEYSVLPEASPSQEDDTPGREAISPQGPDTSPVHPLLSSAGAASDTACKAVSKRDCAASALTTPHYDAADGVLNDDDELNSDDSEEECSGSSVRLSCLPAVPPYEERSEPAEGGQSDSESDADNSESDSDSSVDYDIPPVDDRIYDPQFDPYFYQGSISLDDVPDDQPIDYPCPYDINGDYLGARQFTPHFSYLDHWSGSVVTAPGDLYRSQSQPEAVTQDQPLDGDAPLHVFLSQPIPTQALPGFSLENSLLRPRKQGQFSSLCSFGGSQLYTITEEVEYDDTYDDFYSRRNYSESNLYFKGAEDLLPDPHFIRADLYYGDTDSDATVHSESSDERDSTETLDQDTQSWEILEPDQSLHTSQLNLADSIVLEAVAERDSSEELVAVEREKLDGDSGTRENSPQPGSECPGTEYPDEFFLFCSEAEVTGVDVMESVDVLPYNNSKGDFTYFKVENKTTDRNSPVDHDFLLESYSCRTTMSSRDSTSTTGLDLHNAWQAGLNGTPDPRKGPSSHVYQNIPLNRRISKSNPDLALGDDEVDQGRVMTRPIYQNVPVPAKRHHTPGRDSGRGLDNLRSRDSNSNYYDDWTRGSGPQVTSPYMNVPHNGHGSDNSLHNLNSFRSSSSLSSSLSDGLDRVVSNGHSEEQRSSSGSLYDDQRTSPDLRYVGRSLVPPSRAFRGGSVAESSSSGSFTAYASNTSLDHDTFSKTSKIYKWNGSSSVSDLTSLSRDLSSTSSDLSRGSASACDLTQVGGEEDWGNEAPLGETSYAAWCARVQNDDGDDQDFVTTLGHRDTSPFVFTPHQKAAKRAMMEFCVHNLSSDTDSDASTSSTTSSTSSSDDDCEDDGRSYQVTAPGEVGLATIEEDAEEDSGAESSGHWMFSADNTDTDSVIHVPAALTPAPVEPPRRHPPEDGESTASDETLVVEDDEEDEKGVCGGDGEGRGGRQEAGVTVGNSLARTPATTPAAGGHYDSSASEDEHGSQGTERPAGGSSLRVVHRRRRKPGDGRPAGTGASLQQTNMLGPSHATRIFEKHVDDVFDFESLESCESVSGGSEASSPGHPGSLSGLEEPDAVFNMSATSQPFADSSPIVTDEAARITMTGVSPEVSGELEDNEGSSAPSLLLSEEARTLSLASTPSGTPAGGRGEEIEGDLNNVISNSDTDLVLPSTNSDGSQPPESSSGPQSMDMFGLPVRWTPGHDPRHAAIDTATTTRNNDTTYIEAEKTSVMQMRSDSDTETFANTTARPSNSSSSLVHHSEGRSSDAAAPREADLLPLPDGARAVSIDDVQVGSAVETMVACEAQQQEAVSAAAFTPYTTGENSSEARHCHSSHGPAHHHHISLAPLPQQSEGETFLLPPSCAANQDVNEDTMRDALLPPLLQGNTATKTAVGGVIYEQVTLEAPESKPADIHSSREAGYISSGLKSQPSRAITCGTDLPSGDSDTDTDNTDGDYDEEDHFAAELSLRISSMPAATATKVKSFRSSDILNLIGLERGGAGPREVGGVSDDVSPPASQAGSSPEVPDSLRSSEGRSATRSVETLSEDSGLGDRDVRLTPSSPLAPISEAAPSQAPATPSDAPVSSRPRRQDARQARIARARSLGDLRSYSDSDSEEEEGAMYRWQPHPAAHQLNEGMNGSSSSYRTQQRPYKPSYTNYLLQQQQQRCGADAASRLPPRPLPFSGSEGSDEELRSRFTNHRVISPGHSKPRRHKSFHEASRQDSTCWPAAEVGKGNWAAPHGAPRPGRRRPQPISVDLAEQFLSQEGLKSPQRKQTVENPYGAAGEGRGEEWRMQHPPSLPGTGGVAYQAARAAPANQKPPCEASTNGVCVGSVGSGSEQCPPASSLTPELTVLRAWPAAQAAPSLLATPSRPAPAPPCTRPPVPAPLPHQYSSTPAQLPNECQPVHTGRRSSSPTHDPPGTTDIELRAASDLNEQCLPGGTGVSPATPDGVTTEMAEGAMRVHTKTYGSHGEVEVYLAKCDNGCRPPNTSPVLTPRGGAEHRPGSRGVTFSPSVKEINWRESYYEAEPEGEGSGSDVRKVLVVTSESPTPQRVDLTPSPPPSHAPTTHSQDANNTPESSPAPPGGPPHDSDKSNGRVSQAPAGSSSDAEMGEDKSPKVQTPLWQRFKLPKISSPKSPRPKIPPKPQSLSSRSSDTESSKMSSPGMDSSSSTPSSPDIKTKKAPSSPRFFSWGSKREKKVRVLPPRPLVSPPPPPGSSECRAEGEVTGVQGGVKGEPDPATAVSPAALPREDSAGVSDNSSEPVRQEAQRVSAPAREERVTRSPVRLVNADRPLIADSDGLSHGSGRSPLTSATSGEDSSDAGQQHSPRSALSKPPLPPHLQRPNQQVFHKARLLSARRQYFSQERQVSAPERSSPPKELPPPPPAPKPREVTQHIVASRYNSTFDASNNLKERFERFSASARAERERLARSTPDLSVIEASVRRQGPRIDLWSQSEQQQQQAESHPASPASASDGDAARPDLAHRGASSTHQKARAAIHERYKNRAQRIHARARSQNSGVLETDLDTGASREVLTLRETNLDDLYRDLQHLLESIPPVGAAPPQADKARAKSLLDLEATATMEAQLDTPARPPDTRAKSMEFLLDDGNKASIQPPENELMKGSERQLSEAELRVRRSLQRLDVPEWMKNAPPPQQGFLLRRRDYGSSSAPAGGWSAYSSKTASMTSLGSSRAVTPNTPTKVVIPTRVATRGVGGVGGVTSPASNCSISPSPSDRSGSLFQYPISRWSTSRLNSGTTTPTGSVTSSRTTATYTRQPYLGWRSQTSLANLAGSQSSLTSTGSYLTAADRLALGITAYSQRFVKPTPSTQDKENSSSEANAAAPKPENPEQNDTGSTNGSIKLQVPTDVADVHSSIKEVTSAIVHYCNESTPSPRASPRGSPRPDGRAPSPRRLVWVESSFVGSRPITSPETPTSSTHAITPTSQLNGHDLPESGEVPSRPPQPPEVVSLVNSLSSACSSLRDSSRDSTAASTNDSTAVIVDSSLGGDSSRADSRHSFSDSGQSTVDRSTVDSRHSTADTVNSGLSSRNIDSLNSRSSVLSSRSSGECSSRGSVGSSSRSSSSRAGGSRDDIEASPGSGEADDLAGRPSVGMFEDDLPVSVSASSTLVVRPALHPSAPRSSPVVLSTFQGTNNEVFQFGAATHEESRRSSEASGGVTEGMGRERHTVAYGEAVGYDELFKSEESGDELFTDHYGTTEPDPHNLGPDSTTLEDVLDSLLALPSASRSPSPVCGHHPLGRPFSHPGYTKSHQEKDNTLPSSPQSLDCPPKHQDDHYGSLRNHNLPTDCKPDGYHKSFSYSSSSGESSFQQQQQQAGARPLLHQQHPPPPPEGSPVSFFLARDEGEPHSEPPTTTTTTTTTTHTPSRARTAQAQSHVHLDPSGRAPTTRRLDTLEAQGPEGTFTARQVTEADPSTGVLLHQSTAVVTHPHSHAYSAAPIPPAHTNLSQNAHISPTHHPRLSSPTSDSLTSHRNLLSSSSHNIVPPTPPSYTTPTTASRHVNTTFTHPTHSLSSTLPNCVITASPVPVNSHHTTLPQSHSRSAPSDTRPSHPPASSPRAGTSPGHTTRSNLHKGHHQPHVPGHFVPDSQGSGQVNQLGTSPPKRSSQEVVPASPADPLTEALMLSGVIAAVPSIVERQPPPPPPAGPRVTFHLPPRHMNIPPDSSSENGNGNENVRVDADDDSTSSNIVKCRNPSCGLTAETDEARSTFKTCHNCSTFYCSRACRRQHWERHKKQCKRISSLAVAKQVVARVREDEAVLERVSAVARRGIRALGRGTVKIFFHDIRGAETFVGGGELPETHYMTIQNLLPQETGPEVYKQITELCKHYNVEYKLVLYVSICIMNEIPTGSSPKWEREMVSHCAKLRLAGGTGGGGSDTWSPRPERHVITRDMDEPETMILTSAPIPESNTSPQAARHIAFNNIVRHLREKGISLRHQYPDVHKKLTAYVELGEVFPPLTIYPRDVTTGSTFMCIIMPETDHAKLQLLSNDASKVRTIDISRPHPPA